jgi:ABC-type microcin C transport system permease subunit YejB
MTQAFASPLTTIVVASVSTLIGYLLPILGFFLIVCLFILVAGMHAFRIFTVKELLQDSLRVMKGLLIGGERDWLRRAPWIGLLCGGALRSGHDLILGLGVA